MICCRNLIPREDVRIQCIIYVENVGEQRLHGWREWNFDALSEYLAKTYTVGK